MPTANTATVMFRNNNDFEVNSLSPLALQHGDSSVLERHHVFTTFQVGALLHAIDAHVSRSLMEVSVYHLSFGFPCERHARQLWLVVLCRLEHPPC